MNRFFASAGALSLLAMAPAMGNAAGADVLQSQCIACHAIAKPEKPGLNHVWNRKGPDLFYAGRKFNKDWLVQWLQNPAAIRPAGEFYFRHVKAGEKEDVVDQSSLTAHPKLSKNDATAAADALMALTGPTELVASGAYKGEKVAPSMGGMFFNKLRGCGACHSAAPGTGGESGPELYTAARRLQPDFIYSYIKDPQKFDPHVWMPNMHLSEPDLQRLTGYLVQMAPVEVKQ